MYACCITCIITPTLLLPRLSAPFPPLPTPLPPHTHTFFSILLHSLLSYTQNLLNEKGATYVFNHVHLILSYHKGSAQNKFTDGRIVRAQIQLASCQDFPCSPSSKPLSLPKPDKMDPKKPYEINYSYTVEFLVSENVAVTFLNQTLF